MKSSGFTLLEVLLAMAITALVAIMAYGGFSATTDSIEGVRRQGERVSELNRAWNLMTRDLTHFIARPVRNEFGNLDSAMMGGEVADQSLAFTRTGWHNTTGRIRSNMQRVRYVLEDTTLYRENYLVLDRTNESEPQRVALLENVNAIEFRFLSPDFQLRGLDFEYDNWPEAWGVNGASNGVRPPEAVEVRLDLEDWGEVRWLYELPQPAI